MTSKHVGRFSGLAAKHLSATKTGKTSLLHTKMTMLTLLVLLLNDVLLFQNLNEINMMLANQNIILSLKS